MQKILILGAGMSSSTLIRYLLDHSGDNNWQVTVADRDYALALSRVGGHSCGRAVSFDMNDPGSSSHLIGSHDVVVSMLPARMHSRVARYCLEQRCHMITASYVSDEMRTLDGPARETGIALINELGVDPGIDHMSSMKLVDNIRSQGGSIQLFMSSTGGLMAPEYDNNPWNYKFTWNPRNVVLAGQGMSMFIRNGRYKYIPYHQLFTRTQSTTIPGYGRFEVYPNRDSLKYREIYGLENIPTIFRGTLRRPGFCEAWNALVQLGMTDNSQEIKDLKGMSWRQFTNSFLRYDPEEKVENKVCQYLNLKHQGEVMKKLQWLGLFEEQPVNMQHGTPAQILQNLLEEKWALEKGDKDMIVMQHKIRYTLKDQLKEVTASMVVKGREAPHTAMAITVGMPVAIAVKLLLTGIIKGTGIQLPTRPAMYNPILRELETNGIRFTENTEVL